jgi:perosamine synthetase
VTEAFERDFAAAVGAPHAVAVSSGTAALHLALKLLDLPPGTEVITSPITFVGANEVILHERCTPVFADVDPETGLMDLPAIAAAISPRTGAIVVTHLGGYTVDLDGVYALAARHHLPVIEDAAHACGSRHRGAPVGSHPGIQSFSFQATKNLTTVDGGMVCVRTEPEAARLRRLRWMGIDRDTWQRHTTTGYRWGYEVCELGHKYAMNDLNASLGLAHLPRLAAANEHRRALVARYRDGLHGVERVRFADRPDECQSACYLAAVVAERRDELVDHLDRSGVSTGVHYRRNDHHPIFGGVRDLPGAERYWRSTLSLPLHSALTEREVDVVVEAIRAAG